MEIGVSNRVVARNGIGRFISECEAAATTSVEDAIERGAALSIEMAPKGAGDDPRTIALADSIYAEMTGATSGHWIATARHALPVEFGSVAHDQTGDVSFFWEAEGRMWEPGPNIIKHPAVGAQPYLRPAYKAIMGEMMQILKKHYPS